MFASSICIGIIRIVVVVVVVVVVVDGQLFI